VAYQLILNERSSWDDNCQPIMLSDDEMRGIPEDELESWKEGARFAAVSRDRLSLEDGARRQDRGHKS
jgi:hypothetical protein